MATWIAHLRIAENLLNQIQGLDPELFAIGNIAPDSGIPDENWEHFTPPPEVTHFKVNSTPYQCNDLAFYSQYLNPLFCITCTPQRYAFALGYFFHLVTDNLWSERIIQPTKRRWAEQFEADPAFIWEVKKDWYGLDQIYARSHPDSLFHRVFLPAECPDPAALGLEFLPKEGLQNNMSYIKQYYTEETDEIRGKMARLFEYLSQKEMDGFVEHATRTLLWVNQVMPLAYISPQAISVLQIPGAARPRM